MGSFFTNVHLRTENRPQVEQAWQDFWETRGLKSWAWVSPVYDGWVSVFDWHCDRYLGEALGDLSASLSRACACSAIAFQVINGEVARYWLFNNGDEIDTYTSDSADATRYDRGPGANDEEGVYDGYGPDSRVGYPMEEDRSDGGNLSQLRALTGTAAPDVELEAILRTPAYVADDILTALASALGINDSWAALGYHYLTSESNSIRGVEHFRHLPPGQPPNPQGPPRTPEG